MIDDQIKIHNKFSFELKLGFVARRKKKQNDFVVNSWMFIPNSLDINPYTYQKKDFYRDLKSNIRLITPVYLLRDIIGEDSSPSAILEQALKKVSSEPTRTNTRNYEYHIKMFGSIFKSAVRNETKHILNNKISADMYFMIDKYVKNITSIMKYYRDMRRIINVPTLDQELLNYFFFGEAFMSNVIEQHAFKMVEHLKRDTSNSHLKVTNQLIALIKTERDYKTSQGFPVTTNQKSSKHRSIVHQFSMLKKYVENVLFLSAKRKKHGVLKEQFLLSLAAGLSMIVATAIAFSFQKTYGNFTTPLFMALVVGYMLKDRIKELGRYYFAPKMGKRYFDHKTDISINNNHIGWSKDAADFISEDKIPSAVVRIRNRSAILEADNRNNTEKIILYRKRVRLNRTRLDKCGIYPLNGINEIIRFNISNFTNKMDNPQVPLYFLGENNQLIRIKGEKIYFINLIMQFRFEEQAEYRRYRISMNRTGIKTIESLDAFSSEDTVIQPTIPYK